MKRTIWEFKLLLFGAIKTNKNVRSVDYNGPDEGLTNSRCYRSIHIKLAEKYLIFYVPDTNLHSIKWQNGIDTKVVIFNSTNGKNRQRK